MNIMLIFLGLCLIAGLWAPPKLRFGGLIVVGAVLMVLVFWLFPHRM